MVVKSILKYMFIYLAFLTVVTVLVWLGYNHAPQGPAIEIGTTSIPRQFSPPSTGPDYSFSQTQDSTQIVLEKMAPKLGISAYDLTQAFDHAQSETIPPSPSDAISQDGEARAPQVISDNMSDYLSIIFDRISGALGISATQISEAWQETVTELKSSGQYNSSINSF
jgi:hypothetical protein